MNISRFEAAFRHHIPTLQQSRARYAVLVPLVDLPEGPALLYEIRSKRLKHHAGEICFPGGKLESGESTIACALRETQEELHIPPEAIEVIGELDFLYLRSEALLCPVLAQISAAGMEAIRCEAEEVSGTLLIPVKTLTAHPPKRYRYRMPAAVGSDFPYKKAGITPEYPWQEGVMEVPIYEDLPYPLWGLTARITYWLLHEADNCP